MFVIGPLYNCLFFSSCLRFSGTYFCRFSSVLSSVSISSLLLDPGCIRVVSIDVRECDFSSLGLISFLSYFFNLSFCLFVYFYFPSSFYYLFS